MVRAAEPKVEIKVHPASEIAQGQVVTVECDIVGDVSDTFDTHGESRFPRFVCDYKYNAIVLLELCFDLIMGLL